MNLYVLGSDFYIYSIASNSFVVVVFFPLLKGLRLVMAAVWDSKYKGEGGGRIKPSVPNLHLLSEQASLKLAWACPQLAIRHRTVEHE